MATVIATLTATLLSTSTSGNWGPSLGILALGIVVLWGLFKSALVERQLNRPIAFALRQFSKLDVRDYVSLLELSSGFSVTELIVEPNDWVTGKTLVELGLAREGVLILGIHRHNGIYLGAPSSSNRIEAYDTLVIYGPLERLEELDSRCHGPAGDKAHKKATREYDEYLDELKQSENNQIESSV